MLSVQKYGQISTAIIFLLSYVSIDVKIGYNLCLQLPV